MIYLDNAATTLTKPQVVIDAVTQALTSLGNAARGAHEAALTSSRIIYETRIALARLLGAPRPDHVVFKANVTDALNVALYGLLNAGDHVVTTVSEHNAVLRPLYALARERGVTLAFTPLDASGRVDLDAMASLVRSKRTHAIVVNHASNITGQATDLGAIHTLARASGAYLIVDAAQTAGAYPIDLATVPVDVLCFTGHKSLFGPQGTGGLIVREGVSIRPLTRGGTGIRSYDHDQPSRYPTRLEAGTPNGHGLAGLNAALSFVSQIGVSTIAEHDLRLARRFAHAIATHPAVRIVGDLSRDDRVGIVSFALGDVDANLIADALATRFAVATRAGAHCAPLMHDALGTTQQGVVRASVSWFTTEDEIDRAAEAVVTLAEEIAPSASCTSCPKGIRIT